MPAPASVLVNLERSAQRFPGRCAIRRDSEQLSYGELWRRVQFVAGYLHSQGLRPGERVALLLENSSDFVAALYGTLLAGGVAVALNAAAKARELTTWLAHSEAGWLIAEGQRTDTAAIVAGLSRPPKIILSAMQADAAIESVGSLADVYAAALPFPAGAAPDSAADACIAYTSGTTGSPKGVVLTHGNLASNTASIVEYLALTPDDSILSILPFYYSYGASVLHTHIQAGACIVLEPGFVYPHVTVAKLAQQRITGFAGVPSTYSLLLSRVDLQQFDLSALRYLTQAGGAMSPELTRKLRAALPKTRLFVMYGQTEATARLTYLPPELLDAKLGSVGMPIAGVELQIRGENGEQMPPQETGEVWVRGPNVMKGYWRDPAATGAVLREGWLKTGDLGYRDADGYLYLLGRRSDMIKTGAHRVHPRDIEEVLLELEQIAEAAVVGIDDAVLGQAIAAFVVPAPQAHLDALQIKAHCRNRLANYKIPKSIDIVATLPRTASGKVRRGELVERKQS